jgi:hypothetical protein
MGQRYDVWVRRFLFLLLLVDTSPLRGQKDIAAFLKSLPEVRPAVLDATRAMALVAMPLSCIDHPQARPNTPAYLYVTADRPRLTDDFDRTRAFYGCFDWHSAVNSTWTMVMALRRFPDMPVAKLIREKLNDHLGRRNIEGEVEFFKTARSFEQPYGRAWVLKLQADLIGWDDPDAKKWIANLEPLVKAFTASLSEYMKDLPYVTRAGLHSNTAYSLSLILDYGEAANDGALKRAVVATAKRVYGEDTNCPTAYEPAGPEFLSPCLEEAKLMSRAMDQREFVAWLDRFLPAVYSPAFRSISKAYDTSAIKNDDQLPGKSHLIGLAFSRAEALLRITEALPANDPRVTAYRRLAAINGQQGFQDLAAAGYLGSHWLATYALRYALAMPGTF